MGLNFIKAAAAAAAMGLAISVPTALGHRMTPTFEREAPQYDGLGRKKPKAPLRPVEHNAKRRTKEWRTYREAVLRTHTRLPDGSFQEDPRDDKYLHSSARGWRALRKRLAA